jgi:pyruvate formate lyase activating enzyme
MHIKGLIKNSLVDFPGHVAAVVFAGGCNFRCPFCQNAELVIGHSNLADIPPESVIEFLKERQGFLDGLVVSGGEPTLQSDWAEWLGQVKGLGFAVKLDTNGYRPDVLAAIVEAGLADYVAMDCKSAPRNYSEAAGLAVDLARIEASLSFLRAAHIPYELRTTVVPGLLDLGDMDELARFVQGTPCYALQQFRPEGALSPEFQLVTPYPIAILQEMASRLETLGIPTVLRGA